MKNEAKVIAVTNYKGGVGKSTVTINLGYELENLGFKVLMIDFDGQKNITTYSGMKSHSQENNIITALDDVDKDFDLSYPDPILKVGENLDIITCDVRKNAWKDRIASAISKDTIMKRYVDTLRVKYDYDYILIDTAPSAEADLINVLAAADRYLIVTEAETGSVDAITTLVDIIMQVKKLLNPNLEAAGILINKFEKKTTLHRLLIEVIQEVWDNRIYIFNTVIPKSIAVGESQYLSISLTEHNNNNIAAAAFKEFTKEFVERTNETHEEGERENELEYRKN